MEEVEEVGLQEGYCMIIPLITQPNSDVLFPIFFPKTTKFLSFFLLDMT